MILPMQCVCKYRHLPLNPNLDNPNSFEVRWKPHCFSCVLICLLSSKNFLLTQIGNKGAYQRRSRMREQTSSYIWCFFFELGGRNLYQKQCFCNFDAVDKNEWEMLLWRWKTVCIALVSCFRNEQKTNFLKDFRTTKEGLFFPGVTPHRKKRKPNRTGVLISVEATPGGSATGGKANDNDGNTAARAVDCSRGGCGLKTTNWYKTKQLRMSAQSNMENNIYKVFKTMGFAPCASTLAITRETDQSLARQKHTLAHMVVSWFQGRCANLRLSSKTQCRRSLSLPLNVSISLNDTRP